MVKLEVTAGTNINHIRRAINAQEIQPPPLASAQEQQNSPNHTTMLALSIGEHQSQLGFLQAYEQNLTKLESGQKALQENLDKPAFDEQLEHMMDIIDNTIYAGQSLFGRGMEYGLKLSSLEGIDSDQDVQNLGEHIAQIRQTLAQKIQITSVALINTLSAMGTQNLAENERETHSAQLQRVRNLLADI